MAQAWNEYKDKGKYDGGWEIMTIPAAAIPTTIIVLILLFRAASDPAETSTNVKGNWFASLLTWCVMFFFLYTVVYFPLLIVGGILMKIFL